ncbi:hypothetical protein [Shewanella fodinae]|uniref:Uncharacterized protein n=1 Tax=Shewanella fodinae TaxID=552357 RepID=A0A4R2F5J9_9GAMM|nr:hypothetical protein [Shewanella fodinae]TCN75583.1 hypothetical protein EDC91_1722 [Shewanella fodinae]
MKDIQYNLPMWRQLLNEYADFFFFGINLVMPKGVWDTAKIEQIAAKCSENQVHFVYYMQGSDHFHVMEWDKEYRITRNGITTRQIALIDV